MSALLAGLRPAHRVQAMPPWMDGSINFLPYRPMRAVRLRRRRRIELAVAACAGLLAALVFGEAQRLQLMRADARMSAMAVALKQMEPGLAQSQALSQAIRLRARRMALIAALAVPRDDAFNLLSALGDMPALGIALDEVRYRAGQASVSGVARDTAHGQQALADWLGRLNRLPAFESVEIADIQRKPPRARVAGAAATPRSPRQDVGFSFQIRFPNATAPETAGGAPRAATAGEATS